MRCALYIYIYVHLCLYGWIGGSIREVLHFVETSLQEGGIFIGHGACGLLAGLSHEPTVLAQRRCLGTPSLRTGQGHSSPPPTCGGRTLGAKGASQEYPAEVAC